MRKRHVGFRLDEDLFDFVKQYASSKRMPISQVLHTAVLDFVQNHTGAGDNSRPITIQQEGENPRLTECPELSNRRAVPLWAINPSDFRESVKNS